MITTTPSAGGSSGGGGAPSGAAGGKLSGTYPNPGLNAASTDLTDTANLPRLDTVNTFTANQLIRTATGGGDGLLVTRSVANGGATLLQVNDSFITSAAFHAFSNVARFDFSAVFNCPLNVNTAQTNVNNSTSGLTIFSQPFQGSSYKKALVYVNAAVGTAVYTYPTPFVNQPMILGTLAGIASTTLTTLTITGTNSTGIIIVEGY